MEDHIEVIHNKSFVEGLSLENNLIYIISKFLLINLSNYFVIERKHIWVSWQQPTYFLNLNWPTLGINAND